MSKFSQFMRQNKIQKENTTYAATKSLLDAEGNPLLWTIKPLTTKANEEIRESCMEDIPIKGKSNIYRPKLNTAKYLNKMLCACIVYPNLYDKELQDSYEVMTPEDLLVSMIDDPGEYQEFVMFIQKFNGFDVTLEDRIEQAKN